MLRLADRAHLGAILVVLGAFLAIEFNLYTDDFRFAGLAGEARAATVRSPEEIAAVQRAAEERQCLAEALYYEARGEGETGEKAVAEVVMARLKSPDFPKTICGVVLEGTDHPGIHCQFSFACDGSTKRAKDETAWDRANTLAARILGGAVKIGGQTGHAIAYHSASVTPDWAEEMLRTAQIGNHIFYRRMPLGTRVTAPAVETPAIASADTGEIRSDEVQPNIEGAGAVGDGT